VTRMRRSLGVLLVLWAATLGSPVESAAVPVTFDDRGIHLTEVGRAVPPDSGGTDSDNWRTPYIGGIADGAFFRIPATPVPLPTSAWLFVSGLAGIVWLSRASIFRRGTRSRSLSSTEKPVG
jgi:hypothetical protein